MDGKPGTPAGPQDSGQLAQTQGKGHRINDFCKEIFSRGKVGFFRGDSGAAAWGEQGQLG